MNIELLNEKSDFIFDVDGTLYSQRKMHFYMMLKIVKYYVFHIAKLKDIKIILTFRRLRECDEYRYSSIEEVEKIVAEKLSTDFARVSETIDQWMFKAPLDVISKCKYDEVINLINELKKQGKMIHIYSDYPADKKLERLGIECENVFVPDGKQIAELKPSKNAMDYILSVIDRPLNKVMLIGDREDKDGASARIVGMSFCNVKEIVNK